MSRLTLTVTATALVAVLLAGCSATTNQPANTVPGSGGASSTAIPLSTLSGLPGALANSIALADQKGLVQVDTANGATGTTYVYDPSLPAASGNAIIVLNPTTAMPLTPASFKAMTATPGKFALNMLNTEAAVPGLVVTGSGFTFVIAQSSSGAKLTVKVKDGLITSVTTSMLVNGVPSDVTSTFTYAVSAALHAQIVKTFAVPATK